MGGGRHHQRVRRVIGGGAHRSAHGRNGARDRALGRDDSPHHQSRESVFVPRAPTRRELQERRSLRRAPRVRALARDRGPHRDRWRWIARDRATAVRQGAQGGRCPENHRQRRERDDHHVRLRHRRVDGARRDRQAAHDGGVARPSFRSRGDGASRGVHRVAQRVGGGRPT